MAPNRGRRVAHEARQLWAVLISSQVAWVGRWQISGMADVSMVDGTPRAFLDTGRCVHGQNRRAREAGDATSRLPTEKSCLHVDESVVVWGGRNSGLGAWAPDDAWYACCAASASRYRDGR